MKQFTSKTQKIGEIGEEKACQFLAKHGFVVLERNFANKFGEIDIIARAHGTYYFFEVKTGRQDSWMNPAENLTKEKLRKFLISVEHYCLLKGIKNYNAQGIVVLLEKIDMDSPAKVELIDIT